MHLLGSKKCQPEEDCVIDEEHNQLHNYGYEGNDYECVSEETDNIQSGKSEKLLDEKLEEEHIEDKGNDTKRNEEADNSARCFIKNT